MDFDEFRSFTCGTDEVIGRSLLVHEQMGLSRPAAASVLRQAQERATLASQFLIGMGGREGLRALTTGVEEWRRQENLRQLVDGSASLLAQAAGGYLVSPRLRAAMSEIRGAPFGTALGHLDNEAIEAARGLVDGRMALAREAAELASALAAPAALSQYQLSACALADRMCALDTARMMRDSVALKAFAQAAAMSNALALATRVDSGIIDAARAYAATAMPGLASLAAHRAFFDASGLRLPRWPRLRPLTALEKRRRLQARLRRNAPPTHVKRAKSLVHQHERVLREIIDFAMAAAYGEDWREERLPECGCKTLLRKAEARGGDPLDHADYAHYRMIMTDPRHYSEIFSKAFDDDRALARLIDDAGRLRARSHHAREFTPEDLRDLRVVWSTIKVGLLALTADFDLEWEN